MKACKRGWELKGDLSEVDLTVAVRTKWEYSARWFAGSDADDIHPPGGVRAQEACDVTSCCTGHSLEGGRGWCRVKVSRKHGFLKRADGDSGSSLTSSSLSLPPGVHPLLCSLVLGLASAPNRMEAPPVHPQTPSPQPPSAPNSHGLPATEVIAELMKGSSRRYKEN